MILPLKFWINLLTPSKNHARYMVEIKMVHNRVRDDTTHNRMVEADMTFGAVVSLSLQALGVFSSPGYPLTFSAPRLMKRIGVYEVDESS